MPKLNAHVSGKVQMAGYRSRVVTIAKAFDLKGYVRNLPDGRVKIIAEGSRAGPRAREGAGIRQAHKGRAAISSPLDLKTTRKSFFRCHA